MAVRELGSDVGPLLQSFRSARRWLWLQIALRTVAQSLAVAAAIALAAAVLTLFRAPFAVTSWLWIASALTPVAGFVVAYLLRPTQQRAVRIVDRRLDLHQRLGTAHELLADRTINSLAPWQIAQASDLARDVPVSAAFPLVPRRELISMAALVAATAVALVLVSLGVVIPNPFDSIRVPGLARHNAAAPEQKLFTSPPAADSAKPRSAALDSTRQILSQIQRQAQRGNLSQAAAASALQQASAELDKAVQASQVRQQALDNLSAQLRGTAAGNQVSQSLRQGDYTQAAQQIRDLGRQSDQLSNSAKQQLGQALSNSAAQSQGLPQLSRPENRASQGLQRQSSNDSTYSMDRLAQAVEDAGQQVIPQNELADTWQQLDNLNKQLSGNPQNGAQPSTAPPSAQPSDPTGQKPSSSFQGQTSSDQQQGDAQQQGASGQDGTNLQGGGSAPGNTPGGNPLGDPNPRLGPDGKPLDVNGRLGDQFSGQQDSSNQPPSVMRQGDKTSASSAAGSGSAASAPAENVFVPGDRLPIVRDYFSNK